MGRALITKSTTKKATPTLKEKVVYAERSGWLSLMPWIQDEKSPYKRKQAFRDMLHHDAVKAPLLQKIYSVSSLDIQATAASDSPRDQEIADFVRYQFTDAVEGEFPQVAESILLPALLTKNSVSEKVWHDEPWGRGRFRGKRFYRTIKTKENVTLSWDKFRNIDGVEGVNDQGDTVRWDPLDFVIFRNLPLFEDDGTADLEAVYDLVWMLDTIQKIHNIHLEKFTSPATVATFEAGSEAVDPDTGATIPMQDALKGPLEGFRARNWLIVPSTVQVQAMTLATRGEAEFMAKCDELRQRIALAICGAYLQMMAQGGPGEMRGNAAGAKSTAELFVWALAAKLASVLNSQAVPGLVDMNYQGADYPKLSLGGVNYAELLQAIQLEEIAQRMGHKLSAKAFGRKYALQTAATPDDILTPVPQAPPGGAAGQSFFPFAESDQVTFAANDFAYNPNQSRGQPNNAGQFGPGGGSAKKSPPKSGGKPTKAAPKKPPSKSKAKAVTKVPDKPGKRPPRPERDEFVNEVHDDLAKLATSAPASHKAAYEDTLNRMPDGAITALEGGLRTATFHGSTAEVTASLKSREGSFEGKVNGFYHPKDRSLVLDGPTKSAGSELMNKKAGYGTYAHEMGHAIDRGLAIKAGLGVTPGGVSLPVGISHGDEWREVWESEIQSRIGSSKISDYAQTSRAEGFAEVCRLMYSGTANPKAIAKFEKHYPKTVGFFRKNGLWK